MLLLLAIHAQNFCFQLANKKKKKKSVYGREEKKKVKNYWNRK